MQATRLTLALVAAVTSLAASANDWQEVAAGEPDGAGVDLDSIVQIGSEFKADIRYPMADYRIPQGVKVSNGTIDESTIHVACDNGAVSYEVSRRVRDEHGSVLYEETVPADKQQDQKDMSAEFGAGKYGQNPASMVCAYMAAKCDDKPFTWPVPQAENPLYGKPTSDDPEQAKKNIQLYIELSEAYFAKFQPHCQSAD